MTAGVWVLKKIVFHLVMKAIKKYGSQIDFSKVMDSVANGLAEQKGALQKAIGKAVNGWQDLPEKYKNQITELAKEKFNELKSAAGEKINQLTSKGQPQLASQEQEEEDYTNDEIHSGNFSYRMSFMVWAMREIIPYLKEISQVCAQADPTELKHAVMKILKTRDTGIPETPRSCKEWAKQNYDWVEMDLKGEYDAYQEKYSKPFNIPASIEETPFIPSEQEETTDEKGAFALKLVKKFKNRMTPDYAKRPEMYMMLKLQNALKKPLMSLSKEEYHAWAKAICDACDSVFGSQEQEELTVEQEEDTLNAYYSQDEPDYENDHHGIWLIINLMRKNGMLRAQGIEGRDDVDDGHAIDAAYDLIEQKLNEEGMWIGDDDHEAERFVSFFGEEIAEEAMKSAIHNQQSQEQEENSLDAEFSDLEEQEAYFENFRAIAELVADQIDRETGKGIDNNMDTLFAIVREVWNNNPDDLYIWDFDDVQEDDCYKFFDKYYETIKNEYLKREHNNLMDATHDDLFGQDTKKIKQKSRSRIVNALVKQLQSYGLSMTDKTDIQKAAQKVNEILDETGDYPDLKSFRQMVRWCTKYHSEVAKAIYR